MNMDMILNKLNDMQSIMQQQLNLNYEDDSFFEDLKLLQEKEEETKMWLDAEFKRDPMLRTNEEVQSILSSCLQIGHLIRDKFMGIQDDIRQHISKIENGRQAKRLYDSDHNSSFSYFIDKKR